jgi:hypothetical protein
MAAVPAANPILRCRSSLMNRDDPVVAVGVVSNE